MNSAAKHLFLSLDSDIHPIYRRSWPKSGLDKLTPQSVLDQVTDAKRLPTFGVSCVRERLPGLQGATCLTSNQTLGAIAEGSAFARLRASNKEVGKSLVPTKQTGGSNAQAR